jgi:hypothetical protein
VTFLNFPCPKYIAWVFSWKSKGSRLSLLKIVFLYLFWRRLHKLQIEFAPGSHLWKNWRFWLDKLMFWKSGIQIGLEKKLHFAENDDTPWVVCLTTFLLSYLKFLNFLITNFPLISLFIQLKEWFSNFLLRVSHQFRSVSVVCVRKSKINLKSKSLRS